MLSGCVRLKPADYGCLCPIRAQVLAGMRLPHARSTCARVTRRSRSAHDRVRLRFAVWRSRTLVPTELALSGDERDPVECEVRIGLGFEDLDTDWRSPEPPPRPRERQGSRTAGPFPGSARTGVAVVRPDTLLRSEWLVELGSARLSYPNMVSAPASNPRIAVPVQSMNIAPRNRVSRPERASTETCRSPSRATSKIWCSRNTDTVGSARRRSRAARSPSPNRAGNALIRGPVSSRGVSPISVLAFAAQDRAVVDECDCLAEASCCERGRGSGHTTAGDHQVEGSAVETGQVGEPIVVRPAAR